MQKRGGVEVRMSLRIRRAAALGAFLVAGVAVATSCRTSEQAKLPSEEERVGRAMDVLGRWEWTESQGGIAGIRRTPGGTGTTWSLEFLEDGRLVESRTGEPAVEKSFRVEDRPVCWEPQRTMPALVVPGELDRLIDVPAPQTLVLQDNVVDGFLHRFERVTIR
jgi:hypothetical protein